MCLQCGEIDDDVMSFLDTIIAYKLQEVAAKKRLVPRSGLESMPGFGRETLSLVKALRDKDPAFIAEIKCARPSNDIMHGVFDPLTVAEEYIRAGAAAVSMPTDEKFILGSMEHIEQVRDHLAVPVLQRDYIIDSHQLYEARAYGADAALLMAAVLEPAQIADLAAEARSIGLECVIEIHNEDELEALDLSTIQALSINNRDPFTFEIDTYTSVRLKKRIPGDKIVIADGGVTTMDEIDLLLSHGIHAFLLGNQRGGSDAPAMPLTDLMRLYQRKAAQADSPQ